MALLTQKLGIELAQDEADFLIPDLEQDRPYGIDPFLLFKSKDKQTRALHNQLLGFFEHALALLEGRHEPEVRRLLIFPEPNEIALGYSKYSIRGRGVGAYLGSMILETIKGSEPLLARGLRHIEELQLIAVGIGKDRVSDITANVLKGYLIRYTQAQCRLWNIPVTTAVTVRNVYNHSTRAWTDVHASLPVRADISEPVIFVPRNWVRLLPWINYGEYASTEFSDMFFEVPKRKRRLRLKGSRRPPSVAKENVVEVTRKDLSALDRYVDRKEREYRKALPCSAVSLAGPKALRSRADSLVAELRRVPTGTAGAEALHDLVLRMLNFALHPHLSNGRKKVRTLHGTEVRDIVFLNESDHSFLEYVRQQHRNLLIVFEVKNSAVLTVDDFNQLGQYLGRNVGYVGFMVCRKSFSKANAQKALSVYNNHGSVILELTVDDMERIVRIRRDSGEPVAVLRDKYRRFMESAQ